MAYYAIQVKTRAEEKYIKLFSQVNFDDSVTLYFPRRRLQIRRRGKICNELAPIFPGYVFIKTELTFPGIFYWKLRRIDGFYRFLKSNQDVQALSGKDLKTILHFIGLGPVAEKSKVYFDEQDKIVVREGPLKGLEGSIVKVDKRKGRAKIKLDLYDNSFSVDLAFEVMNKV